MTLAREGRGGKREATSWRLAFLKVQFTVSPAPATATAAPWSCKFNRSSALPLCRSDDLRVQQHLQLLASHASTMPYDSSAERLDVDASFRYTC